MASKVEEKIIELIATDRLDIPISSMSGKLKRRKPKLGKETGIEDYFEGERAWARVSAEDGMKARGMREGIEFFSGMYPRHGRILRGYIEEERTVREVYLYFGVNHGCRLTADDYMGVMRSLGFSDGMARTLYPELMEVSRKLVRQRDEERSVMIG